MAGYIGTKAVALSTTTGNILGDMTVGGTTDVATLEFNSLSGTGSVTITDILDEDNLASNSATKLATQQSIKAYVDAQVDTVDTLAEILAIGNRTSGAGKIEFRDAAIFINSSTDGQLDLVADTEIQLAATTVDLNGNLDVSGTLGVTGNVTFSGTTSGIDMNGTELVLDADGDTGIIADTDDRIDFKIAGSDRGHLTYNSNDFFSLESKDYLTLVSNQTAKRGLILGPTFFKPYNAYDNTLDLGIGAARWKDLYLSGNVIISGSGKGINFAEHTAQAGGTSQILDRYEEGSFTPTFGGSGGNQTVSYSVQLGTYVIIGNLVYVNISIIASGTPSGGSGDLIISGLPFTSKSGVQQAGSMAFANNITFGNSGTQGYPNIEGGVTYLNINSQELSGTSSMSRVASSGIHNSGPRIVCSISYSI